MDNKQAKEILQNELRAEELSETSLGRRDGFRFVREGYHRDGKQFWQAAEEALWLPQHLEAIAQWMRDPKGVVEA